MLKYKIRLSDNDFKENYVPWREKYIAPDLSFISGVTDFSYHLDKYNDISISSPSSNQNTVMKLETEVVTRLGYVIAREKEYPIKQVKLSSDNTVRYVEINGMFFYAVNNAFTIKNWQCEDAESSKIIEKDVIKQVASGDTTLKLDTIYWIEDGYVTIDDYKYIFDKNEDTSEFSSGCLKYYEDGGNIDKPTECSRMEYHPYTSVKDIHDVCKFKATSTPYMRYKVNNIKFNEFFFYVEYKDYYYPIIQGDNTFYCLFPNNVSGTVSSYTETYQDDSVSAVTIGRDVQDMNDLINLNLVTEYNGTRFPISNDYRVSNNSKYIMVDLEDQDAAINIGDKITFENAYEEECFVNVDVDNGVSSVLYDGNKYVVEANLFDKVLINDIEYDVTYDDFNKEIAYVYIDGEQVPMKLNNGTTLSRYGLTMISGNSGSSASSETYSIKSYSGVTIEGKKYMVSESDDERYGTVEGGYRIKFTVVDIKGNSLLICLPYISANEYSTDFINNKQYDLANTIVDGQTAYVLQHKNTTFGLASISKEMPFSVAEAPFSSDVYYLLDSIVIENKNGYINIPINLNGDTSPEVLKSEIIEKDFIEEEKKKAINKIVDLEKDVYTPKYLDGNYAGSTTEFKPIFKINVNLHFRTRNLDNWKVNEGYNNISVSGQTDNWFITDYYPYKTILEESGATLMETSDLLGLLNFTNDDVFYQKSKLSKSFLRMSVYDSTDPQTQSLLSTATVFVNEHNAYKKFIDNSRKNEKKYKKVSTVEESMIVEKISVDAELIGDRKSIVIDESTRLSSRFVIENKYDTEASSEGFYLYIFREYSKKLRPKPIYMKIEYNHAGIGKTIPFIVPMNWDENGNPDKPLLLDNENDLESLKNGIPLSYVYAQTYIPLYAVYDFKNKEYAYVFDKRYIGSIKNGVLNLNLFELKVKDDSDKTNNIVSPIINVNEQFSGSTI